jgi:Tol biopolymer transport system component
VVYVADQDVDDVFELYVTDGSAPVKLSGPLVSGGDVVPDPMFSPDGSRVYYRADQDVDGRVELYVVPSDGSAAPVALNGPLVAGGNVEDEFRTTPDGSVVVFRADALVNERFDLFATSADGSGSFLVRLNSAPADVTVSDGFLIDANGSRVVFHADDKLFGVPALGGDPPTRLDDVGSSGFVIPLHRFDAETPGFRITPDGSTVLYRALQETVDLWAVAIDGVGGSRRVNAPIGSATVGNFDTDPTGETVAYVRWTAPTRRLWLGPLDGSSLPVAIDDPAEGIGTQDDFTFSDDGRSVIYRNDREALDAYDLFTVLLGGPRLDLAPTADPTPR